MITFSHNDKIYLGRNAGRDILQEIRKAKHSIKIISPYLTPSYVEELVALNKKGVDITLITADDVEKGDGRYSTLDHTHLVKQLCEKDEEEAEKRSNRMFWSGIGLATSGVLIVLSFLLSLWLLILGLAGMIVAGIYFFWSKEIVVYTYSYETIFKLKICFSQYCRDGVHKGTHLIHSKVFVVDDDVAFVGSVNFTHSGLVKSYETAVRVTDKKAVKDLSEEVDRLFNTKEGYFKDIQEWGKELYTEPPN